MAKKNSQAKVATETQVAPVTAAPAAETAVVTAETKKGRKPALSTVLKNLGIRVPTIFKSAKATAAPKEHVRITGATVDVAIINYANWRSSAGDGTPENPGKWGIDEIVNGTDKKVAKIARFRPDLTAIVVDGVGQKYGGFISADPKHVNTVVERLRTWEAQNAAKPTFEELCATCETEDAVVAAVVAGNVRAVTQFTMLENFVEVPPKPRKPRAKKEAAIEDPAVEAPAAEVTAEVAAVTAE